MVQQHTVTDREDGLRIDRWLREQFPSLSFSHAQKLMRTGQIRVEGKRTKPGALLQAGQTIRIPPFLEAGDAATPADAGLSQRERDYARSLVIYEDADIIALNKPSGLATQGGTKLTRHVDRLLPALAGEGADIPRIVHRLDKDTSGVLLTAKTRQVAKQMMHRFQGKRIQKSYLAIVLGVPPQMQGTIDLPLCKKSTPAGDRMCVDMAAGQAAQTDYCVLDQLGDKASLLLLMPRTGRTHQLRVHCTEGLGCPILGDDKYGGGEHTLPLEGVGDRLHLHAWRIEFNKSGEDTVMIEAPLPVDFKASMAALGLQKGKSCRLN